MSATPRGKRLPAQPVFRQGPWTVLGPGSVIYGELLMAGDVAVHGRVEGVVFTDGTVRVVQGGAVEGGIHARRVIVEGFFEGRLEAYQEVEIRAGAVVRGDIYCAVLTLDDGARFEGAWLRGENGTRPRIFRSESPLGSA